MCILWLFSNPIFHYTAGEAASWIHIERGMLEFIMWGFYCLNKDPSVYVKEIIPCYLFIYSYAMFLFLTSMVHKDADELCLSNGANSFCLTLGFFCLNYENSSLEKSQIKKTNSLSFLLSALSLHVELQTQAGAWLCMIKSQINVICQGEPLKLLSPKIIN